MPRKDEILSELLARKTREIVARSGNYAAFLRTAARNYKYTFREQVLIHAQRPDATACAEIDIWNRLGRRVNRGATGIALLRDPSLSYRIRYVFDISDTNSRENRDISLWQMKPEYENEVIQALQDKFLLNRDGSFLDAVEILSRQLWPRRRCWGTPSYPLWEMPLQITWRIISQTCSRAGTAAFWRNWTITALQPSEQQKKIVASLSERAEKVRNKQVDSNEDNMLVITNDGRKLALDQRLINPMLPDSDTGKVAVCAENVYNIWERTAEKKSTQMVFVDLSTPHNDGQFNVYDDLKKKLLDKGIPESEIAYIHDAKTEAAKKELFGKVRSGEVRVLIGSTQKMGAGTNARATRS